MGDLEQRLLWLDIPHGRVHRFDPVTGSDDVFGVGQAGSVRRPAHRKIKVSGRLSGTRYQAEPRDQAFCLAVRRVERFPLGEEVLGLLWRQAQSPISGLH